MRFVLDASHFSNTMCKFEYTSAQMVELSGILTSMCAVVFCSSLDLTIETHANGTGK